MKIHLFFLLIFLSNSTTTMAQLNGPVQQEINDQLWRPFIRAYSQLDAQTFLSLHTADVIRITRDNDQIRNAGEYSAEVRRNMTEAAQRGTKRTIELRFTERFADGNLAFEEGYYKVVNAFSESEQYTFYGKFHVILRKENGRWKVLVDSDTNDEGRITATEFLKARPM